MRPSRLVPLASACTDFFSRRHARTLRCLDLDLDGHMAEAEVIVKLMSNLFQQPLRSLAIARGHNDVRAEGNIRGTHRPDV